MGNEGTAGSGNWTLQVIQCDGTREQSRTIYRLTLPPERW